MGEERKRYSAEFKRAALERMAGCENVTALAVELGIRRKFLYKWRDQVREQGDVALGRGPGRPKGATGIAPPASAVSADKTRIAELERLLGRKQLEIDFFRQTFEHVREVTASNTTGGAREFTKPLVRNFRLKEED